MKNQLNFIKINIVEKFNSKNGNKYNADVISEFILISIEEFLYDEFVLKNLQKMKDDDLKLISKIQEKSKIR